MSPEQDFLRELGRGPMPVAESELLERAPDFPDRLNALAYAEKERVRTRRRLRKGLAFGAGTLALAATVLFALRLATPEFGAVANAQPTSTPVAETKGAAPTGRADYRVLDGQLHSSEHDWLTTVSGSTLELGTRAVVRAAPGTALRLETTSEDKLLVEQIALESGRVSLEVPPLGDVRRLRVRTPEVLVEVKGTGFEVRRDEVSRRSFVSVHHGLVSVLSLVSEGEADIRLLGPGENYATPERSRDGSSTARPNGKEATSSTRAKDISSARSAESRAHSASQLAEANRLYREAVESRNRGDLAGARAVFRVLVARYPESPAAEIAARELTRTAGAATP